MIPRLLLAGMLLFSSEPTGQDRSALSGIVTLSSSSEPVEGVQVTVRLNTTIPRPGGVALGNPIQATTDRRGQFSFTSLNTGQYLLTLDRNGSPGFVNRERNITVVA